MKVCTFFGHSNCPSEIEEELKKLIEKLIISDGVTSFLVGDKGNFDNLVRKTLERLSEHYDFQYQIVLAYMPYNKQGYQSVFAKDTNSVFPEELATVHKRYAIEYRNKYMLDKADLVVTYITHNYGGAAKFARKATLQKKCVINLAEKLPPML